MIDPDLRPDLAAPGPARRAAWPVLASCLAAVLAVAACGGGGGGSGPDAAPTPDAPAACNPSNPAMTYTQLYNTYFAATVAQGHCAKSGCHGDPDHNVWLCGPTKDTCYAGMVTEGLINMANPIASKIADPAKSPLYWINANGMGFMPADNSAPFPAARDAITAWVHACAQNN